jgi:hypothetical protein
MNDVQFHRAIHVFRLLKKDTLFAPTCVYKLTTVSGIAASQMAFAVGVQPCPMACHADKPVPQLGPVQ